MGQVARWLERLTDFNFEVGHRSRYLHGDADGLARLTWESINSTEQDEDAVLINSVNVELEPLSKESIKAALKQDPVLSQVVNSLKTGVKPARCDVEGGGRKLLSYW